MRADICTLVASLTQIKGIQEINMTTNGYTLPKLAKPLFKAGLRKANISLDTLDPHIFHKMSRGFSITPVLEGIEQALAVGFSLKLNAVILKDTNEDAIFPLIDFCSTRNIILRFIEYMPFEARWHSCITSQEIQNRITERFTLSSIQSDSASNALHSGPAQNFWLTEKNMMVGFISPLSNRFCSSCNRLRLSAKGELRTCLAHEETPSLGMMLRNNATDEDIKRQIRIQVLGKKEGHLCEVESGTPFQGVMTQIGG
jgi:cyclic pyranopterin phosphate synthase